MSQSSAPSSDNKPKDTRLFFIILFAAGIIFRFLYLLDFAKLPLMDHPAGPDIGEYCQEAIAILHGGSLSADEQIHAPLYGFFLAALLFLTGKCFFAVRFLQSMICLGSGLFYWSVLQDSFRRETGPEKWIPHLFLAFYALYPPFLMWQCDLYSENLLPPLLGCSLFLLHKAMHRQQQSGKRTALLFIAGGIAAGCAALVHPLSLAFAGGMTLFLILFPNTLNPYGKWTHGVLFAAAVAVTLLPCAVIRSLQAGKPVLIQQHSAFNFYLGNHEQATGTCCIPPGDKWNRIHAEGSACEKGADYYFAEQSLRFILQKPGSWLLLMGKKAILPFCHAELTTWSDVVCLKLLPLHRFGFLFFPLLALPGLAAFFLGIRERNFRHRFALFLILGISSYLMQILLLTSGRYRIPMVLSLMALAPWFFLSLPELFRKKRLPLILAMTGAIVLVFIPVHTPDIEQERNTAEFILAYAFREAKEPAQAEQHLRNIIQRKGGDSELWNLLGTIQMETGRPADAEQSFQQAAKYFEGHPTTEINLGKTAEMRGDLKTALLHYRNAEQGASPRIAAQALFNMGVIFQNAGDLKRAETCYVESVKRDPLSAKPLRNLAILHLENRNTAQAEQCLKAALKLEPDVPERSLDLAYLYFNTGRSREGNALLNTVLKKDPANARAAELKELIHGEK